MSERVGVDVETFVKAWIEESEKGGSCESLAQRLDREPLSVYQRGLKLNTRLLEAGQPELPKLPQKSGPRERKSRINITNVGNLIAARKALDTLDSEESETVTTEKSE